MHVQSSVLTFSPQNNPQRQILSLISVPILLMMKPMLPYEWQIYGVVSPGDLGQGLAVYVYMLVRHYSK